MVYDYDCVMLDPSTVIPEWITAIAASLALPIGLGSLLFQIKKQRLLHSATEITELDDRFNSADWCKKRRYCADVLKKHNESGRPLDLSENFPVVIFFDSLSILVQLKALDLEIVWRKFGWYVIGYWISLEKAGEAISAIRTKEGDKSLYTDFQKLYAVMAERSRKIGVDVDSPNGRELRIQQLLVWELGLEKPLESMQSQW